MFGNAKEPLLLAEDNLFELLNETDIPLSVVSMERQIHPKHHLPQMVKVLNRKEALEGLRNNRFSCLLAGMRRGPYWDKQRPLISRLWDLRTKIVNDPAIVHYQICTAAISRRIPTGIVSRSDCYHIDEWNHWLLSAVKVCWLREFPIHPSYALINTTRRLRRISGVFNSPIYQEMKKVRPISIGVADSKQNLVKPATKRYDIFYSASNSNPMREEARNVLLRLKAEGKYQVYLPESSLPQEDFYKACAESYLVISPAGAGWDCYRHYEAAMCGSVPVMNYPDIRRYRPFLEGDHAFFYDLEDGGLERCIRRALADRARLVEMGQNARRHVLQYHLYSKLLSMMLKELSKLEDL